MSLGPHPRLEHLFTATVDVGSRRYEGSSPEGDRYAVDILGGTVGGRHLNGVVLPGGTDQQVWQTPFRRRLCATYAIQLDDGIVLQICNRVMVDDLPTGPGYRRSALTIEAPSESSHGWLNNRIIIGSFESLRPAQDVVRIHAYLVT
ncbi:MAG: DUF3237 domain-containing protein [Pigmentiphaga sp.]|nr:DUF3237 domain-containing protein [Pigmentiphaga sp.]